MSSAKTIEPRLATVVPAPIPSGSSTCRKGRSLATHRMETEIEEGTHRAQGPALFESWFKASQHRVIRTRKSKISKRPAEVVPSLASYMGESGVDILDDAPLIDTYPAQPDLTEKLRALVIRRGKTITRINDLVQDKFGRRFQVRAFGSTCYGAGRFNSDLDLCVFDHAVPNGFAPSKSRHRDERPPIYSVHCLADELRQAGFKNIISIADAAVPIVRLTDPETGISCDINVNHQLGWYNTVLIRSYALKCPGLPPLIKAIKGWARRESPSTPAISRAFTSYAMTLMLVAFLQSHRMLPNFQSDPNITFHVPWTEETIRKDGKKRYSKADVSFGRCSDWNPRRISVFECMQDWLAYWGYGHDYTKWNKAVSIRDGGLVDLEHATRAPLYLRNLRETDPHGSGDYCLVVLDPFLPKNCTAQVHPNELRIFQKKCREQYNALLDDPESGAVTQIIKDIRLV